MFTVCNTIFMILFIIITLYPILNTLALAFNEGTDALRGGIYLIPRKWTLKNFITVLQKDNLITGAYITVARTLIGTFTALITNAILAFIVSRKDFYLKTAVSFLGYYDVCKWWYDSNIFAVQRTWVNKQFLGICDSGND